MEEENLKINKKKALIIANGESCSDDLLNLLLSQQPFVVVLDGAIHRILQTDLSFDVLLGDFDRDEITFEKIREKHPQSQIIHAENQEKTDLEKGIDFLVEKDFSHVNIIWATGKRADHNITNITNICRYRDKIQVQIWDDYSLIELLPRYPQKFMKSYLAGTPISLIPIGKVFGITTQNLKYNLSDETLTIGYRTGSSNEVLEDGEVEISYQTGDLLLMECTDKILGYVHRNS